MCLSVVAKIVNIINNDEAVVELGRVKKTISLGLIGSELVEGDWVLIHTGFAIQIIDEEKARDILAAYEEVDDFTFLELSGSS